MRPTQHGPLICLARFGLCLIVICVGGCTSGGGDSQPTGLAAVVPADFPFDLGAIPLSQELATPIHEGLSYLGREDADDHRFIALAQRDTLVPGIQRPETRHQSGDQLYRLWQKEPTNFLWLTIALRYNYQLQRTAEMDSMLALPALADTNTAVGAYAYAVRHYSRGSRGRFYTRAADLGGLEPLTRLMLVRKTAMVLSHHGEHLAGVRELLAALPEVREVGGPRLETRYWLSIVLGLKRADRLDDAIHAVAMGLHCAAQTNNPAFVGIFRKHLAGILAARQEYEAALAQFEAAAEFGRHNNLPWVILDASDKAAELCSVLGRPELALKLDRRNLTHSLAMSDSLNAPRNMMNLADDFLKMGAVDSSLVYQQRAQVWVEQSGYEENKAGLPFLQAEYYCHIGRYDTADSLLTLASARSTEAGLARDEARLLLGLIKRGLEMSQLDLAYRSLQRLQHLRPVIFNARPDQNMLADFELATAELHMAQGEFQPAAQALKAAWAAIVSSGGTQQKGYYHQTAGKLAVLRGDRATAYQEFSAGLELALKSGQLDQIAVNRQLLGRIMLLNGEVEAARGHFVDHDQDPSFGGSFRTRLTNLRFQGRSWRLAGDPVRAQDVLVKAVTLKTPHSPADVMAGIHLELGLVLTDLGRLLEAKTSYDHARVYLNQLSTTAHAGGVARYLDDTQRQLAAAVIAWHLTPNLETESVSAALEVANWALLQGTMTHLRTKPFTNRIGDFAPAGGCVGLYFLGRDQSYLWVGHEGQWRVESLPGRQQLAALVVPVAADLGQPHRTPDQRALAQLGAALLAPLLSDWATGETLTIIADGFLSNIPWPALILPGDEQLMAVEWGAVIESPGLVSVPPGQMSQASGALLAIGYNGQAGQSDRLRNAEREARLVAGAWSAGPAESLVGQQALWSPQLAAELGRASVLHLASHARVREGWFAESSLMLAGKDGMAPLTTQAITDLGWSGQLVFLSSCEAGRSHMSGRGMMGLAGAFLSAGAQAVLASTGEVDDDAGLFLAQQFYKYWLAGETRAAALRSSQLEMIRTRPQWSHPYFWSHYRLIVGGSSGPP